jgi:hypothetical protein
LYEGEKKKTIREEERERNEWGRVSAPQERMGEDRLTHDSVCSLDDRYPHGAGLRIGSGLKLENTLPGSDHRHDFLGIFKSHESWKD